MSDAYYEEAYKAAQKEKRRLISQGQHPYLPVLEDMIPAELLVTGTDIGVVQVPAEYVVGTKTAGRTNAFAGNFMPLLSENSEFGIKWKRLCDAHLEEGIRDPVKVYEYMNRFYVEEGNKRVSVLKFFEAVTIPAHVIRILPPLNDSPEVKLYYEFLEFYRYSKINFLEFSQTGSYAKFLKLLDKKPNEYWISDERYDLNAKFYYFRNMFYAAGGKKLQCTDADAFLVYIRFYGYQSLSKQTEKEIKQNIQKIWEELKLFEEDETIDLITDPDTTKKTNLLQRLLFDENKVEKAAFLYDKTPAVSGWTYGHELGRQHIERVFSGKVITTAYENVMDEDPLLVIQRAIEDGNKIIFTTSPKLLDASLTAAIEHPDAMIFNCSLTNI